jgi:hypothetical protein
MRAKPIFLDDMDCLGVEIHRRIIVVDRPFVSSFQFALFVKISDYCGQIKSDRSNSVLLS